MMSTASKAATIDIYAEDYLTYLFGNPVDWSDINGVYDVTNFTSDDYVINYNYIPMSFYIPQGSMADLTLIWTTVGNDPQWLATYVLTDEFGMLNTLVFSMLLESYECLTLEVTSTWLGQGELIPNPLPPSVMVFMTAMLGVGYLARRRRNKTV